MDFDEVVKKRKMTRDYNSDTQRIPARILQS